MLMSNNYSDSDRSGCGSACSHGLQACWRSGAKGMAKAGRANRVVFSRPSRTGARFDRNFRLHPPRESAADAG